MSGVVERYFEMWNTGDTRAVADLVSEDWLDHAHPEIIGPGGVQKSVEQTHAGGVELRFELDSFLADGPLVAAVGAAFVGTTSTRLIWLVRLAEGRMAEMWTYREVTA